MNWLNRNHRCPVCRYDIRTFNQDASGQPQYFNQDASGQPHDISQNIVEDISGQNIPRINTFTSLFQENFSSEILNMMDTILENPNAMSYNSYIYSYDASGNAI
jgi:hypothetical protein